MSLSDRIDDIWKFEYDSMRWSLFFYILVVGRNAFLIIIDFGKLNSLLKDSIEQLVLLFESLLELLDYGCMFLDIFHVLQETFLFLFIKFKLVLNFGFLF